MNHLADEELVQLVLHGRKDAFDVLVRRYQRQLFNIAFNLSGNYEDAADWAQESFLQIYRSLSTFDIGRGKFFSWMYRITHNVCINKVVSRDGFRPKKAADGEDSFCDDETADERRKSIPIPLQSIGELETPESDIGSHPERHLERTQLQAEVQLALSRLDEKYRIPIMLQYLEGMSYKEISEQMNLPQSTIETRLFRARQMLQKSLSRLIEE